MMVGEAVSDTPFDIAKLEGDYDGTPQSKQTYYHERRQRIKDGEATWMVRNFDARENADTDMGNGIVYDFYVGSRHVGMIVHEPGYTEAYAMDVEGGRPLAPESLALADAVVLLETEFS